MNTRASCFLPELLAPAGSLAKLKAAVLYGASAVYLGGKSFSLRARAANFSHEDLLAGLAFAHAHGVKVYAALNIFARNADIDGLTQELVFLQNAGLDACIVADPGVIRLARKYAPGLALHLSTQANVTNSEHALFWQEQGLARINLARELSLPEIQAIRARCSCQLEVFVHGALCISYSGRCLLSSYLTGRDANQGDCAQPCRYAYALVEEKRPGQYFPIEEDARGAYVFNSRDLCLLAHLPKLINAGVDALKIEGRVKSEAYVAQTVRLYRLALLWIEKQVANGAELGTLSLPEAFLQELSAIGTRGYTENFFGAESGGAASLLCQSARIEQSIVPVGLVRGPGALVETRTALACGETIECLPQDQLEPLSLQVLAISDATGKALDKASPNQLVSLHCRPPLDRTPPYTLLRRRITALKRP